MDELAKPKPKVNVLNELSAENHPNNPSKSKQALVSRIPAEFKIQPFFVFWKLSWIELNELAADSLENKHRKYPINSYQHGKVVHLDYVQTVEKKFLQS